MSNMNHRDPQGGLWVSEIFGPTFQGEGPYSGRQAVFVRLQGCNLACAYCDTPYAREQTTWLTLAAVCREIFERTTQRIVITGGEPLLQPAAVQSLCEILFLSNIFVEIETNGTLKPLAQAGVHYNVSPKLRFSGNPEHDHVRDFLGYQAAFKFVCRNTKDVAEVDEFDLPPHRVWIMPEGKTLDDINKHLKAIWAAALERHYNVCDRLHIRLFGGQKGW